jgi:hypothetical protein
MKLFYRLLFIPVAAVFVVFAVANRHAVTLDLWPLPLEIDLPVQRLVRRVFQNEVKLECCLRRHNLKVKLYAVTGAFTVTVNPHTITDLSWHLGQITPNVCHRRVVKKRGGGEVCRTEHLTDIAKDVAK